MDTLNLELAASGTWRWLPLLTHCALDLTLTSPQSHTFPLECHELQSDKDNLQHLQIRWGRV